jgi:hypothetical protein
MFFNEINSKTHQNKLNKKNDLLEVVKKSKMTKKNNDALKYKVYIKKRQFKVS